ncbi:MAG: phosphoglycerate dehydrogenase [Candidatus Competibacteraceae bacterium]|uniref:D-3-phosphoglycerate dehydrogenase n=1 Tax=Candidatus Contendobacter odensis Run_B_J11 TaxID=1400861 RepID=A0A7U7GFG6_9GAMM|nr:phosphoglycerate dehydrogenase [Candidatus Contendobacter odensis]MBK8537251.1 phosphoglycerate dehydrogenase [Candidatus Competibacteraceae bacterium]MBK8754284.1 phosphoglycerate dehydrogenase [Candidatus Competibacteraceae bacterium]CDH47173.1 D-3-phosphoglycerate dehydrogenase [Candidatus Contendobacter odensis Run_B_J11]
MSKTSLDKSKIKILLLEGLHASAVEAFQADGYTNIEYQQKALPEPQLLEAISDAYVVGIRSATQLTARILEQAPRLMGIGCFCIGTNQVDLDAAQEHGIPVFNAPFSNTRSVAELVLAEIILLLRGIPQRSSVAHRGGWVKTATGSHEARGKCLGIVGYGHIGTQTGLLAEALGMRVVFYDIETKLALGNAQPLPSLDVLLEVADVVTLHVPETPQTYQMIGAAQLARMKPGASLINAARGTVVDVNALVQVLESKHLSGAALDVFPEEPKANDEEFVSPLRRFDNVLLTPHVGGSTEEAQQNIGLEVASKLIKYSNNGSTVSSVNFPEVTLPEHPGKHRLLHIHRNQPGVLSRINAIFSEQQINIAGQYLQTNAKIGYVVIDVDSHERAETLQLKKRLDEIAGTIRTRILY